ncbi:signal peptidase II [bacterium]|nr:signal peptidase II [bacterium]MBU1025897.1 signal peptidase II [bacterium]
MPELWKYRFLYISAIVVLFAFDQGSKLWAIMVLDHHNTVLPVINGFLEFKITYNDGAAWGILSGWTQGLAVMSTVMIIVILTVLGKTSLKDRLLGWALTFQVSGAFGNLYDRLSTRPGVVDFINVYIPWGGGEDGFWYRLFGKIGLTSAQNYFAKFDPIYDYPIFNLADIWVVIGTVLLLIYIIRMPPEIVPEKVLESTAVQQIPEPVTSQPVSNPPSENHYEEGESKDDSSH